MMWNLRCSLVKKLIIISSISYASLAIINFSYLWKLSTEWTEGDSDIIHVIDVNVNDNEGDYNVINSKDLDHETASLKISDSKASTLDSQSEHEDDHKLDAMNVGIKEDNDNAEVQTSTVTSSITIKDNKNISTIQRSDSDSTLASEIISITYETSQSQSIITINFDTSSPEARKCQRPVVRGRLSGPALTMIDWEDHYISIPNTTTTSDIIDKLIGKFNVPGPGRYFIEIIGMLCNRFDLNDDFKDICVENPINHRLTANDSTINIHLYDIHNKATNQSVIYNDIVGHWMLNQQSNDSIVPLYTRFQPLSCRKSEEKEMPRCDDAMNHTRYDNYEFQFTDHLMNSIENSVFNASVTPNTTICSVGFSHSRVLNQHLKRELRNFQIIKKQKIKGSVEFEHVKAKFPKDINPSLLLENQATMKCTDLIVAVGQWSGYKHVSFPIYQKEMENAISNLLDAKSKIGYRIFLRSIHYQPLGDWSGSCPNKDWRHPFVIDGYNNILRGLSRKYDLPFIDTNFVVSPMWDHSWDWCHLDPAVGSPESLYILAKVMEEYVPKQTQ